MQRRGLWCRGWCWRGHKGLSMREQKPTETWAVTSPPLGMDAMLSCEAVSSPVHD